MKRLLIPAALIAAVLGVVLVGSSGAAKPTKTTTITVIERNNEGGFHFTDLPPRASKPAGEGGKVSPNDQFALNQPLRNQAGRRVGILEAICTAARGGAGFNKAQFVCHGGYRFKRGTLALEAMFTPNKALKIAITGGTGAFIGASGVVGQQQKPGRTVDSIHLLP